MAASGRPPRHGWSCWPGPWWSGCLCTSISATPSLSTKARFDDLTRLPNRHALLLHLRQEFKRARRYGYPLSLLVLDIDDFKRFSDELGHRAGDDCLRRVASAIQSSLRRPGDFAGRFGGEELAVVLSHAGPEEALSTAEILRAAVENLEIPAPSGTARPVLTVSVGVASLEPDDEDPEALFDRADAAMYSAKGGGKHRVASSA